MMNSRINQIWRDASPFEGRGVGSSQGETGGAMTRTREISLLIALAAVGFATAFAIKSRRSAMPRASSVATSTSPEATELAALGLGSGRELVAYVLLSSHCDYCQRPETKEAVARIRTLLVQRHSHTFRSVKVVGVAVNSDIRDGFTYLNQVGLASFDEISVGSGWRNDEVVRLIWKNRLAEAAVPQVIVVSDSMKSSLNPLALAYAADTVLLVVSGVKALVKWVRDGVPLQEEVARGGDMQAPDTSAHRAVARLRGKG